MNPNSIIYPNCNIGDGFQIQSFCEIGKPHPKNKKRLTTNIGSGVLIRSFTVIYEGVSVSERCTMEEYTFVSTGSMIGARCKLHYRAQVYKRVQIGDDCRIGGFLCNDSQVKSGSSVYGSLLHKYRQHGGSSGDVAPRIGRNTIIGFHASVIGVTVGDNCIVAAGAVVTHDIPDNSTVTGINEVSARD